MHHPAAARGSGEPAVVVEGLRKSYRGLEALSAVSFEAYPGEIVGVLGPNGAGKTTLIEILEGLRLPGAGRVTVLGTNVRGALDSATRNRIGVAMQATAFPQLLTVWEALRLYASFYSTPRDIAELLRIFDLTAKRDALIGTLSGGQRQRLAVALGLVGNPDLLFLDEPTSQLDPRARRAVWDILLDDEQRTRRCVLLTTHQMEEAQRLCSRVAILDRGAILAMDTPARLIAGHCPGHVVRFHSTPGPELSAIGPCLATEPAGERVSVSLQTEQLETTMTTLMQARSRGMTVENLRVESGTLEDVFLRLTGRRMPA